MTVRCLCLAFTLLAMTCLRSQAQPAKKGLVLNVQGVWTKDDMVSIHRKKSHQQVYLSHLDAGKSYLVDLKSKTDPFLLIETEDGQLVVHNDDGGPGTNSRILFRPKQSGYYRVVATTFRAGAVGSYQLTIAEQ